MLCRVNEFELPFESKMQPHPGDSSILISRFLDLAQLNSEGHVTNGETDGETDWPINDQDRAENLYLSSPLIVCTIMYNCNTPRPNATWSNSF